ncbi:MAG: SurA N-terminal domain-containing protein [Desulfuromonadaceae bacterium]|nr:SurA N-terminal domain-containing protein [Desulfuromonadaceae bacterium]
MLGHMRSQQKSVLIKVAFAVIILSFVIGYAMMTAPGGNGTNDTTLAATVNGEPISYQSYQTTYGNLYRFYQNVYREQFSPALEKQLGLRQQALEMIVEETLLLQEAKKLGLSVSKAELVARIAQIPAFQDNGVFSKERYLQSLAYQRMTSDEFEALQTNELLAEKVRNQLKAGITVSDAEIETEFKTRNEKVTLAFIRMVPALFENKVKVTERALEDFFADKREEFRLPERLSLRYLQFEPARYADEITFSDEEISRYYRRHLVEYDVPEQAEASHILIKIAENADEDTRQAKRKLAEKILAEVRDDGDFAALAKKYSDDQGTAKQGGSLGYFGRGAMVASFEKAAFALQPGAVSDIVETPFGLHIIKTTGYIAAGVKPLAEVSDLLKSALRTQKARELAMEKAMDAFNINRKTGNLDDAATDNNLGIKETGFFARDEAIDGIGVSAEISSAAFSLEDGKLARPVAIDGQGIFLLTIKERQPSRLPELSEVRAKVEKALRSAASVTLAKNTAEQALKSAQDGARLGELAKKFNVELEETEPFSRSYGDFVPRLGNAAALVDAAFALPVDQSILPEVYTVDGNYVLAKRTEQLAADMSQLDGERAEVEKALLARKEDEAVNTRIKALKDAATIVYTPILRNFLGEK